MNLRQLHELQRELLALKSKYGLSGMEVSIPNMDAETMGVISVAYSKPVSGDVVGQGSISIKAGGVDLTIWGWKDSVNEKKQVA